MFTAALPELVAALGGELIGDAAALAAVKIDRIAPFEDATPSSITFLANKRLQPLLPACAAGCVIVAPELREAASARGPAIVTPDPYLYYARLTQWWVPKLRVAKPGGIHASAVVDATARVAATASIGPLTVIEADVEIADDVVGGIDDVHVYDRALSALEVQMISGIPSSATSCPSS